MNIYLIRHGDAETIATSKSDFDRQLIPAGRELVKKSAQGWKKIISNFDVIASSPLTRAIQTAEIIAEVFEYKEKVLIDKRLTSGCTPEDIIDFIYSVNGNEIAIVGHQPDLSHCVSAFVSANGMFLEFGKGDIAKINFPGRLREGNGTLKFLIPSDLFK